jgi:putative chitobiose transport system permease protein
MIKPTLAVVAIFQAVRIWNDYQWPLIVSAGNRDIWVIALGFQRMLLTGAEHKGYPPNSGIVDYTLSFTMAVVATLPTILLYLWLQDYFVEGVKGFSIKG